MAVAATIDSMSPCDPNQGRLSNFDPLRASGRAGATTSTWSEAIVDASLTGTTSSGLRFRGPVPGPEHRLVGTFLASATIRLLPGRSLTVFVEPSLDSGFPDIVAVVWRRDLASAWLEERSKLVNSDLRLLHLLATVGPMKLSFLESVFRRELKGMLARLQDADVISVGPAACRARSLSKIFAVERIIAVEAKVSATHRAIEQASTNSWFSSESHALFPRSGEHLWQSATSLGVGVISFQRERLHEECAPATRSVPLSYGSWLFNEWVWRLSRPGPSS